MSAPKRSFRDRFFTPKVARAITSPSGILLAGAGASIGIVAGLPIAAVIGLGALAWGGRVAAAVPRDEVGPKVDPDRLREPWRGSVASAVQARRKFAEAAGVARGGPLRARLEEIGARLDDGVDESWRIARQGQTLTEARSKLDTSEVEAELAEVEAELAGPVSTDSPQHRTLEALRAQLASAERLDRTIAGARDQLRLLNARMDEAVARAVELSVSADDDALDTLGTDVDGIVGEMEALRQGLEEADQATA